MHNEKGLNTIRDELEEFVKKTFKNEILQMNEYKSLVEKEYENRSTVNVLSAEHKEKIINRVKELKEQVENSEYITAKLLEENYIISFNEIVQYIIDFPNRIDFLKLLMSYQRAKYSVNKTLHFDKFDWFSNVVFYDIKWECSFCKSQNKYSIDYKTYKRDQVFSQKCKECFLNAFALYRSIRNNTKFIEKSNYRTDVNQLTNKIELIEKFIDTNFSDKSEESNSYSLNDQRYDFQNNKDKITKEVRKFISLVKTIENKTTLKNDVNFILSKERKLKKNILYKYKVIKRTTRYPSEKEIAHAIFSNYEFKLFLSEKKVNDIYDKIPTYDVESLKKVLSTLENIYLYDLDIMGTYQLGYVNYETTGFIVNKFFFETDNTEKSIKIEKDTVMKNLFQSGVEYREYNNLLNKYPEYLVLPNYPIYRIIDFSQKEIISNFSKSEIAYLEKAYMNFAIYSKDGKLIKLYDLQIGEHHNRKEYYEKDILKQKLCSLININLETIV